MMVRAKGQEKGKTSTTSIPVTSTTITTTATNPTIVPLDPAVPLDPKPLIADILRTGYCVPGSVFLVEGIERCVRVGVHEPPGSDDPTNPDQHHHHHRHGHRRKRPRRAVRLILGDGELCIQAFVRSEIHCFVDAGSVYEGCYVRLDKFGLVTVDGGGDGGGGTQQVVYLVVGDMVTVGWNEEYLRIVGKSRGEGRGGLEGGRMGVGDGVRVETGGGGRDGELEEDMCEGEGDDAGNSDGYGGEEDDSDEEEEEELMRLVDGQESARPATADTEPPPSAQPPITETDGTKKAKANEDDYFSDSDSAFETLVVSVERANQRRVASTAPSLTPAPPPEDLRQQAVMKENQHQQANSHHKPQQQHQHHRHNNNNNQQQQQQPQHPIPLPKHRPWLPTTATNPVKLTTLSQIPHLPYRQNWMVNVLAVISWISPHVESSHIAPSFRQRTARIVDPTITFTPPLTTTTTTMIPNNNNTSPTPPTSKDNGVLLTVYLDPDTFNPSPGTVVLLLGVKNHHAEGGSLRKYVSDALVGGGSWWVESPEEKGDGEGLGWCRERAVALREWWDEGGWG